MVNLSIPTTPKDYDTELGLGNIPGRSGINMNGHNPDVNSTQETLWDQGGIYTYLSADTTLYLSSSDALDTNVDVILVGLDDTYTPVTALANSDGQNQVAFDTDMFRVFSATVLGPTTPDGDLYIAELTASPGGVPTDVTKIKAKITQGNNLTRMAMYTVPAGGSIFAQRVRGSVGKGDDAVISFCLTDENGTPYALNPFQVYQGNFSFNLGKAGILIPEKQDLEIRATSTVNSAVSAEADLTLIT
jgi:hypothetical protein